VIACIVILIVGIWLYYRQQKMRKAVSLSSPEDSVQLSKASQTEGMKVDRSIEFSYEELSDATNNFSMEHKIGQGGFGSVYYAELRGEKAAVKKMDTKASHEFLAELKVLTRVHHSNLVHLIGYCVESCLFLVYEFIENGNLSQHLHGTGYEPLSWTSRLQIALDSARGLEYIHEHIVPVYVHRDIKSANILIDKDFRAKILDCQNFQKLELHHSHSHHYELLAHLVTCLQSMLGMVRFLLKWMSTLLVLSCMNFFQPKKLL